jgi:four helix bundle protein
LNISEGSGRGTNKDFNRYLDMAYSSALEVENVVYLCSDLEFINEKTETEMVEKVTEIQKMITGLQNKLSRE